MVNLVKEDVMPTKNTKSLEKQALYNTALKMLAAARTAPKGRGVDNLVSVLFEGNEIKKIANKMKQMAKTNGMAFFIRDAENLLHSPYLLAFGTKIAPFGLKVCGMCGYKNCREKAKHPKAPCVFNTGDLGIAMGSAVSVAMDERIDNRIMFSAGQAIMALGLMGKSVKVAYAIPLSCTGKNRFFDRTFPKK
jgi:uncharacterized ferredoxin-like protein